MHIILVDYARVPIGYSAEWYSGDKATNGLLDLEFMTDQCGPSLVYMKALAW